MRRGEILALRWKDVDLAGGRLSISQSLEETRGVLKFKQPKTAKGRRMITLPPITTEALVEHHAAQANQRDLLGEGYKQFDLVLAREDGSIWKPESFTALYFNFERRIGLKVRFHDLRHTHASQLLRAGISPKVVSERLGPQHDRHYTRRVLPRAAWHARGGSDQSRGGPPKGHGAAAREAGVRGAANHAALFQTWVYVRVAGDWLPGVG